MSITCNSPTAYFGSSSWPRSTLRSAFPWSCPFSSRPAVQGPVVPLIDACVETRAPYFLRATGRGSMQQPYTLPGQNAFPGQAMDFGLGTARYGTYAFGLCNARRLCTVADFPRSDQCMAHSRASLNLTRCRPPEASRSQFFWMNMLWCSCFRHWPQCASVCVADGGRQCFDRGRTGPNGPARPASVAQCATFPITALPACKSTLSSSRKQGCAYSMTRTLCILWSSATKPRQLPRHRNSLRSLIRDIQLPDLTAHRTSLPAGMNSNPMGAMNGLPGLPHLLMPYGMPGMRADGMYQGAPRGQANARSCVLHLIHRCCYTCFGSAWFACRFTPQAARRLR